MENVKYDRDSYGRIAKIFLTAKNPHTVKLINNFNQLMVIAQEPLPNKNHMTTVVKDTFAYIQAQIEPLVDIKLPLNLDVFDGIPVFIVRLIR